MNVAQEEVKAMYRIAIFSDLIGIELSNMNLKSIVNPKLQSKLRNLKKSTDKISNFTDENITGAEDCDDLDLQEAFGDLCDEIHREIKKTVDEIFEG